MTILWLVSLVGLFTLVLGDAEHVEDKSPKAGAAMMSPFGDYYYDCKYWLYDDCDYYYDDSDYYYDDSDYYHDDRKHHERQFRVKVALYTFFALSIAGIGVSVWLFIKLKKRDASLPEKEKYLQCDMLCVYWLICLMCSCAGSILFFVQASNEIERKRLMLKRLDNNEKEEALPFLDDEAVGHGKPILAQNNNLIGIQFEQA